MPNTTNINFLRNNSSVCWRQPAWTCLIKLIISWVIYMNLLYLIRSIQSLSRVWLFATPWAAAGQAFLSITSPRSLLELVYIESVISSNSLILCHPLLLLPSIFPRIRVFFMSQLFASGGQSIGISALASVLPMNIQDRFLLLRKGWISLKSKGLSRVFSNSTAQKHQSSAFSFLYGPTLTSIHDHWKNHSLD